MIYQTTHHLQSQKNFLDFKSKHCSICDRVDTGDLRDLSNISDGAFFHRKTVSETFDKALNTPLNTIYVLGESKCFCINSIFLYKQH